eukprot:7831401-Alexandrium_andersonii.AAC.1
MLIGRLNRALRTRMLGSFGGFSFKLRVRPSEHPRRRPRLPKGSRRGSVTVVPVIVREARTPG